MASHDLYETGDADAPSEIKDRNGEVTLALCRRCGQGEADLADECPKADPALLVNILAPKPFGIGSKVYTHDRYGYRHGDTNVDEYTVIAETRMSWLVSQYDSTRASLCFKLPKKGSEPWRTVSRGNGSQTFYLTREALDDQRWLYRNRYHISQRVSYLDDPKKLREVAALIGYIEKKE